MKTIPYSLVAAGVAICCLNAQDQARTPPSYEPYARIEFVQSMAWSPDDRQIIYANGNQDGAQLYIVASNGGKPRPFLSSPTVELGAVWSPDGARVAFVSYRGGKGAHIWTSDSGGGDLQQVNPSPVNGSARIVWSPDGKGLTVVWGVTAPSPVVRIMVANPSGSDPKTFAIGAAPALSPDGNRVAYISQEFDRPDADSWIRIRPVGGGQGKRLSSVAYKPDLSSYGFTLDWSVDGKRLLTIKPVNGSWQLAVINVEEDRVELTVPVNGSARNPRWSHDGKRIAFGLVDTGHPGHLAVLTLEGRQTTHLTKNAAYTTAQLVRYRTASGGEIPSWLYLPRDADHAKHPGLIWLHGLPDTITDIFIPRIQYLVDQGFVVLVVNYGFCSGFGNDRRVDRIFEDLPDIFASVDYLKALKSINGARIGIVGYSHGGYDVLRSIVAQPDLFSAAVDAFGPSDLVKNYRTQMAEAPPSMLAVMNPLWGGTPEQNPEAYRMASPIHFVDHIKTPLLILHGTADQRLPYYHSADMAEALQREQKQYEFITYKGAGHGFAGKDEIDANQQILRFLVAHLTPAKKQ